MGASVMQLVEKKLELHAVEDRVEQMQQGSADFFTTEDRKELYRQTVLAEQTQRSIEEIRAAAKETARAHMEYVEAHEKRLRALEDARLKIETQIATSRLWIVGISALVGTVASFLVRLLVK